MSNHQKIAIGTLRHYLETAYQAAGLTWEYDNTSEVENIIDAIVSAAVDEVDRRQPQRDPDRPTGPTLAYVRELEAEAARVKAERDDLIGVVAGIVEGIDTGKVIMRDNTEHYLLYWDDYVVLHKIAAANEDSQS